MLFEKSLVSSPGIEVTLDNMPNDGVILVVTDSGSKQLELEKSIRKKSLEKNLKIYFSFSPSCRADCKDSLPVYERISDGRLFNESDFTSETFFRTVVSTVCHHSAGFQYTYGSVSPGRGKWPFRVTFFLKVERSCGQTVKDRHDFSIVLCQLYLLDHQITSRRTSEIFFGIFWHPSS